MSKLLEDIKKLRALTGAGLTDVKKAIEEAAGDLDKAIELIRKRGQAIAAKRGDHEAEEGCILAAHVDGSLWVWDSTGVQDETVFGVREAGQSEVSDSDSSDVTEAVRILERHLRQR